MHYVHAGNYSIRSDDVPLDILANGVVDRRDGKFYQFQTLQVDFKPVASYVSPKTVTSRFYIHKIYVDACLPDTNGVDQVALLYVSGYYLMNSTPIVDLTVPLLYGKVPDGTYSAPIVSRHYDVRMVLDQGRVLDYQGIAVIQSAWNYASFKLLYVELDF